MLRALILGSCLIACGTGAVAQEVLRGHGGPVRALAVRAEARELVSASFDSTVIVWDLERSAAKRVLRFHNGQVNAVALLPQDCLASGGEDRRIAIWCGDGAKPQRVLEGHEAPITVLVAVGNDLVSGSLDGTVRMWDTTGTRAAETVATHKGAVAAAAPILDSTGRSSGLVTGGADGTLTLMASHVDERMQLDAPVTALAVTYEELIVASSDGQLRFIGRGRKVSSLEVESIPLASLAVSPDGRLIATAGLRGGIAVIERETRKVLHRLTGPGLPVWSLAFDGDSRTLLSGGSDRVIRRWDAVAGTALTSTMPERDLVAEAAAGGERGAVVFRACQACHTLSPDGGNRAGPTLHGVFGRRIGALAGYDYSDALRGMQIVWSKETIARLFEIGPAAYTPGTKMPEQTINDPADRKALVDWLERVTAAR